MAIPYYLAINYAYPNVTFSFVGDGFDYESYVVDPNSDAPLPEKSELDDWIENNPNFDLSLLTPGVYSVYDRTGKVIAEEGDYSLTELSDVTLSSPSLGQTLVFNGDNWVNTSTTSSMYTSINNSTPTLTPKITYFGIITTSGNSVDFHITNDGTSTGTALFTSMTTSNTYFQITVHRETTSDNQAPWGYIHSIQNTGRTVRVRIKKSNTGGVLIGGSYQGNLDNDNAVTVYLHAVGS